MIASVVIDRRHLRRSPQSRALARLFLFNIPTCNLQTCQRLLFRTLFQVPYPLSPLLATLTKTAGVCANNSHSGTHPMEWRLYPLSAHGHSGIQTFRCASGLSPFFSHSSALFCTYKKLNSFLFMRFRTLCQKTPGWGVPTYAPFPPPQPGHFLVFTEHGTRTTGHVSPFPLGSILWVAL
jgi:hypothetical protein